MRNVGGMRVEPVVEVFDDQVPCAQGADENQVVLVFGRKADVIGKRRRHMQVDAAASGFLSQEVGLHLDIAIAEQ